MRSVLCCLSLVFLMATVSPAASDAVQTPDGCKSIGDGMQMCWGSARLTNDPKAPHTAAFSFEFERGACLNSCGHASHKRKRKRPHHGSLLMESRYEDLLGAVEQHICREASIGTITMSYIAIGKRKALTFPCQKQKILEPGKRKLEPGPLAPESAPALKPEPRRLLDAIDAPLKIVAALLALIIPSIAAFYAVKSVVYELKRDTEAQTCALAIKVEIMRAINEYQELDLQQIELGSPRVGETDVAKKKREDAIAKVGSAKDRAQKRRAFYEDAEKRVGKRNCDEIERQAANL